MNLLIPATNIIEPTYDERLINQIAYLTDQCHINVDLEIDLPLAAIEERILTKNYDCVFPLAVYEFTEDKKYILQVNKPLFQMLEYHNQIYIGNDALTHILLNDKALSSKRSGVGLPNLIITKLLWLKNRELAIERIINFKHSPFIIKPNSLSSSLGITENSVIRQAEQAYPVIDKLFEEFPYLTEVLLESYVEWGQEYTVSVTGNGDKRLAAVTAMVSGSDKHRLYSFAEKNKPYSEREVQYSADIEPALKSDLLALGKRLAKDFGLRDYCRFDFIVDQHGKISMIDANAMPFLGANYMFEYVSEGVIRQEQLPALILAACAKRTGLALPQELRDGLPTELLSQIY